MINKRLFVLSMLLIMVALVSCDRGKVTPTPTGEAGIANPASVFCEENGGRVEMQKDASGGEVGICVFEDGSSCEEWAFFRGECKPGG